MSSLSDSDVETLQSIGHDTIESIVALCVEAVLWTVYLVLVVVAANILLRKGRSMICTLTFVVVLLMFLMDSAISIIDVHNAIKEISLTLTSNSSLSLSDRYDLTSNTNNLPWPVESALYGFMSNLGDIIIIWRVYAFYPDRRERWVLAIPIALLVGSFVTSGLISFCVAELVKDPSVGNFVNPPFCRNVQLSSYCTTLATTGIATFLIFYKSWQYRRTIGRHLQSSSKKMTRGERVMVILVESGILYFLFFLESVVTDSGNVGNLETATPSLAFATDVWTYMTSHILGIYPVIIVILVHSQKSYIETATTAVALPSSSVFTSSSTTRQNWNTSQYASTADGVHPIEINVHELREMHNGARRASKSTNDDAGDEILGIGKLPDDKKFIVA